MIDFKILMTSNVNSVCSSRAGSLGFNFLSGLTDDGTKGSHHARTNRAFQYTQLYRCSNYFQFAYLRETFNVCKED